MKNISGLLLVGCSALALAGCGADDIGSPGNTGNIDVDITNPTPTPTPTPTGGTVTAATECPGTAATGGLALANDGIITTPQGTWRVCTLPSLVSVSSTLPKVSGVLYRLNGRVDVGCDGGFSAPTAAKPHTTNTAACAGKSMTADDNVTLSIDPGVIVYGDSRNGVAWLAVNRGNKIDAEGRADAPIIFTAYENVIGSATEANDGLWGGIVLLGRGKVTNCVAGTWAGGTCERDTEGAASFAYFGGNDDTYNAGTIKYVQIRYSGFALSPGLELQSLTGGGVGTGTSLDYFQSVNSSDDGSEWFGGAVNFKHYIAVNADDDSLDLDNGVHANFQYGILLQRSADGDTFFEIDSAGQNTESGAEITRRTIANIVNFAAYQPKIHTSGDNSDKAAIMLRGNSDTTFANSIFYTPENECLVMTGENPGAATLTAHSTLIGCSPSAKYLGGGTFSATDVANKFGATTNNNSDSYTVTLSSGFGGLVATGTAFDPDPALAAFFDNAGFIGAFSGASDTWYRGWTCDTATADFGSGEDCTSLPTT